MANTILVTGATGKQGGAVIDALLSSSTDAIKDLRILALTRNPSSAASQALLSKNPSRISLLQGDLKDCADVFRTAEVPIKAVFSVSIPVVGFKPNNEEEIQGKALVDAALSHGVEHFVYTSVDRHGDSETDVPHFISKARVEKHLIERCSGSKSNMTWTILRPVAFMDNIVPGFAGKIFPTAWKVGLSPGTKLQLIATQDIGFFGAQALLRPKEFSGRAISLAGDELTFEEANAIFRREIGYDMPTTFGFLASAALWMVKDVGLMFKFFEDVGYAADVNALRKEHPELQSLSDWLKKSQFVAK